MKRNLVLRRLIQTAGLLLGLCLAPAWAAMAAEPAAETKGVLPGDILVLRPGVYAENPLMNTPLILRATRAGPARIGN